MPNNTSSSFAVTTRDVAERCNVHRTTVSRVLSGDPRISSETVARVQSALKELGYNPALQVAARRLKSRHGGKGVTNHVIACIISLRGTQEEGYYGRLFQGILRETAQRGFALLTTDTPDHFDGSSFQALLQILARDEVDGVVCYTLGHPTMVSDLQQAMQFSPRPLVSLMAEVDGCSSVAGDVAMGGFQAVNHLLELGHRRILFFNSPRPNWTEQHRFSGMQQAVLAHGGVPAEVLATFDPQEEWYSVTYLQEAIAGGLANNACVQALDQRLRQSPEITAIVAWNDPSAIWAWYGLQQLGWVIPRDLSLIGFDDTVAKISETGSNQLTTIRVPLEDIGEKATELLIGHVLGHRTDTESVVLPTQLIIRESTTTPFTRG